ncbi:hypothetical protein ACA910_021457 [Epithemia clementina (nom. ined.)]
MAISDDRNSHCVQQQQGQSPQARRTEIVTLLGRNCSTSSFHYLRKSPNSLQKHHKKVVKKKQVRFACSTTPIIGGQDRNHTATGVECQIREIEKISTLLSCEDDDDDNQGNSDIRHVWWSKNELEAIQRDSSDRIATLRRNRPYKAALAKIYSEISNNPNKKKKHFNPRQSPSHHYHLNDSNMIPYYDNRQSCVDSMENAWMIFWSYRDDARGFELHVHYDAAETEGEDANDAQHEIRHPHHPDSAAAVVKKKKDPPGRNCCGGGGSSNHSNGHYNIIDEHRHRVLKIFDETGGDIVLVRKQSRQWSRSSSLFAAAMAAYDATEVVAMQHAQQQQQPQDKRKIGVANNNRKSLPILGFMPSSPSSSILSFKSQTQLNTKCGLRQKSKIAFMNQQQDNSSDTSSESETSLGNLDLRCR